MNLERESIQRVTHVNVEFNPGGAIVIVHFVSNIGGSFIGLVVVIGEEVPLVDDLTLVGGGGGWRGVLAVVVVGAVEVD